MKNRPKSWKTVLDQRRKENFIGRSEYLRAFSDNFTCEDPEYMVFSITGEGGVGKSTLLQQFANISRSPNVNALIITSDDRQVSPALVMGHIAAELAKLHISHKEFDERYKKYRELREEIESDPKAPRGAIDLLARGVTDFAIKSARKLPGASPFLEGVDEKTAGETFSQLINYGITKWGNKDEVSLLRETEHVLTPLFLDLIAKSCEGRRVVLMFDVFERTNQSLAPWLLQLFNFEFGEFDTNLCFVIARRDPLEQHWTELAGSICHIALEPFTLDETRLYLANQEVTDDLLVVQIYEDTGGLPVLVQLLAATKPQPNVPLADVSKDAVERFLQWIPQEDRRRVALLASVPRQFNLDILTAALGDDTTNSFGWLSMQSFVRRDTERGWFYHEKVRELMLRHLRNTTPKDLIEAHCRLVHYFVNEQSKLSLENEAAYENGAWRKVECERVYHLASTQPERNKSEAANAFMQAFRFRWKFSESIARTCKQVGREKNSKAFSDFAAMLLDLYSAYDTDDYQIGIEKLSLLESYNSLTIAAKCSLLARRGYFYTKIGKNELALIDLTDAIQLDPEYFMAVANRGIAYGSLGRYEEAIMDFSRSIELDPKSISAVANRAITYRLMKRYEEALVDFDRTIEMDEKSADAFEERGATFQMMGKHEEALANFNRAVELDEKRLPSRGILYAIMGKYEKALIDFDRAVELEKESILSIANRGMIYGIIDKHEEALADFSRAIELDENSAEVFNNRGITYRFMNKYEEALADFSRAIQLDGKSVDLLVRRAETYGLMKRYEEALVDFSRAIELDGNSAEAFANRGMTYRLMDKPEEALADLSQAIMLEEKFIAAIVNRGIVFRQMERYEEALTDINRAIQLDKESAKAIAERGLTYREMGRNKQAIAELSRAIELDGNYIKAIVSRGETYHLMGKYEKAILDFNRANKLDEKDAYVIAKRGTTYHKIGRFEEALADLDRSIEIDEEYAWAIANRGNTYKDLGRFTEALNDLNRAIELDANLGWTFESRGVTYRLMGNFVDALKDFDSAIKLDSDYKDGVAIAWRGELKRRLGNYEEAVIDLSIALKSDPKDDFSLSRRAAAYLALGKTKAAQRDFSRIIVTSPKNVADYYNRGVAFVLFERNLEAIKVLKEAFRLDRSAYYYAITDDLLDPIRNLPEFQALINSIRPL